MIPKSGNRFSEKIMLHQNLEREDDSKKRHPALALAWTTKPGASAPANRVSRFSLDHEHLTRGELVRKQFGSVTPHDNHVLDVAMPAMRLDGQHHPLFKHDVAIARHNWLLLMPPAADTMADQP